jgi:hypothetical protein
MDLAFKPAFNLKVFLAGNLASKGDPTPDMGRFRKGLGVGHS